MSKVWIKHQFQLKKAYYSTQIVYWSVTVEHDSISNLQVKIIVFLPDVNFDEYDKSDDPPDYKFVRWLTKEKVGRKTYNLIGSVSKIFGFFIYLEIFFLSSVK